jgi:hypothetical protein
MSITIDNYFLSGRSRYRDDHDSFGSNQLRRFQVITEELWKNAMLAA